MFQRLALIALIPLVLGAAGPCSQDESVPASGIPGTIEGEGTIHQGVGPECPQTWHIATPDGRTLWPVADPAFQVEGLRVRFVARENHDRSSICMAGTIVDVISIRKR